MKPKKYAFKHTRKVDLKTKIIHKYPTPTRTLELSHMIVNGRHPEKKNEWVLEHDCQFVMYVTKGKGKVYVDDETFEVEEGDVVFVPTETLFAVEGKFEYITVDSPAWYPEQAEIVER